MLAAPRPSKFPASISSVEPQDFCWCCCCCLFLKQRHPNNVINLTYFFKTKTTPKVFFPPFRAKVGPQCSSAHQVKISFVNCSTFCKCAGTEVGGPPTTQEAAVHTTYTSFRYVGTRPASLWSGKTNRQKQDDVRRNEVSPGAVFHLT